jgi:hypothetical protein
VCISSCWRVLDEVGNAFVSVAFCTGLVLLIFGVHSEVGGIEAMRLLVLPSAFCTGYVRVLSFRFGYGDTQLRRRYWHLVQVPA